MRGVRRGVEFPSQNGEANAPVGSARAWKRGVAWILGSLGLLAVGGCALAAPAAYVATSEYVSRKLTEKKATAATAAEPAASPQQTTAPVPEPVPSLAKTHSADGTSLPVNESTIS